MWGEFPSGETRHLELSASVLTQDTTGESAGGAGGRPQVPLRFPVQVTRRRELCRD